MVITCEQCDTRFRLDDTRVPDGGVRVRCSRCKHAFFVKPATGSGDLPIERGVAEALAEDANDFPIEVEDTTGSEPDFPAPKPEPAAEDDAREPESDWEFNHEPAPSHDAALAEAQDVVDELLGGGVDEEFQAKSDFFGSEDDVEGDIDALLGSDTESVELAGEEPLGAEESAPIGSDVESIAEAPEPEATVDAEPASVAAPEQDDEPLAERSDDELGSPDEWDFFADDGSAADAEGDKVAIGRIGLVPAGSLEALAPSTQDELPAFEPEPSRVRVWMARGASAAGWAATLGLVAAIVGTGFGGVTTTAAVADTRAAGLDLVGVTARSIDSAAGNALVLIEGSFRAPDGALRGPGARFTVQLLDDAGAVVADDAATLGPALVSTALRQTPAEELRQTLHAAGEAAAWQRVSRGAAWPFTAVIAELPAEATRYAIVSVPVEAPQPPAAAAAAAESDAGEASAPDAPATTP